MRRVPRHQDSCPALANQEEVVSLDAKRPDLTFQLLFIVTLTTASGNAALQSTVPALGRSLGIADASIPLAFSLSAMLWMVASSFWADRCNRYGLKAMVLLGIGGFAISFASCGIALASGLNGVVSGTAAFALFVACRMIYGAVGAAAPPAIQALVVGLTDGRQRVRALNVMTSALSLGALLGPAMTPFLVMGDVGGWKIGPIGFIFLFAGAAALLWIVVRIILPAGPFWTAPPATNVTHSDGVSVPHGRTRVHDRRVRGWMLVGIVTGFTQAMAGQTIGFLIIDRLHLQPLQALEPTGLVLMGGAAAALFAQWGLIPRLDLDSGQWVRFGLAIAVGGTALTGVVHTLPGIALAVATSSFGFACVRPGLTAGASLAVGPHEQASVAGRIASINGATFILSPLTGILLYGLDQTAPYVVASVLLTLTFACSSRILRSV